MFERFAMRRIIPFQLRFDLCLLSPYRALTAGYLIGRLVGGLYLEIIKESALDMAAASVNPSSMMGKPSGQIWLDVKDSVFTLADASVKLSCRR